jgi:CrcB protein
MAPTDYQNIDVYLICRNEAMQTMKPLLIIGLGGGIGSIFRYLIQIYIGRSITQAFPLGTLLVNISGCLIIGLLYGFSAKYAAITVEWRLFLVTGLCGGYTTFSSFSYESISLFKQGNYTYFILYTSLSFVLGLLATVGGIAIVK